MLAKNAIGLLGKYTQVEHSPDGVRYCGKVNGKSVSFLVNHAVGHCECYRVSGPREGGGTMLRYFPNLVQVLRYGLGRRVQGEVAIGDSRATVTVLTNYVDRHLRP